MDFSPRSRVEYQQLDSIVFDLIQLDSIVLYYTIVILHSYTSLTIVNYSRTIIIL